MELEVTCHHGIPETSVISIRAGSTRRQAHLSQLDRPFKFPIKPEECSTLKVDILDLSGTARLACAPGVSEYTIPMESPVEGEAPTGMEVAVKMTPLGGGKASTAAHDEEQSRDKKKEEAAKAYLEKHGLTSFMQFLIQSLMKDKPEDPYAFLQRQVTKRQMAAELSGGHGCPQDSQLEALMMKLSTEAGQAVPVEQLQDLERQAAAAGEQLRKDNVELRAAVDQLKSRYKALLVENTMLQEEVGGAEGGATAPPSPQMDLATAQDEVGGLAQENAMLVSELARMRESIESVRNEIEMLQGPA
eukprot:gb/GFBE01006028.1/.p1 GENE.gb/GFBE01006028.1/~~gb/GFBE01006028.1/.p1  ORF type:complete len:303 (+),score=78.59 gb/GFBE01006028.1/:1-909(+)